MRGPVTSRWSKASAALAATVLAMLSALTARPGNASAATPIQVYGAWLCGTDECTWASAPNMTTFDDDNHWLIDRGDGTPSVNLVVLAFVNPLKLLDQTTDSGDVNGVPAGMTSTVVNYFTSHGIRVMLSIGGVTYTSAWDIALSQNPSQLGLNAAAVAKQLGVGIEIDYENGTSPDLTGLQSSHAEVADDEQLLPLFFLLAGGQLPVRHHRVGVVEHRIPASLQSSSGSFVQNVAPSGAGTTPGMLGYMFWAAGQPSARGTNTFPPDTCLGGVGTGSSTYSIPVPMPALRQS